MERMWHSLRDAVWSGLAHSGSCGGSGAWHGWTRIRTERRTLGDKEVVGLI